MWVDTTYLYKHDPVKCVPWKGFYYHKLHVHVYMYMYMYFVHVHMCTHSIFSCSGLGVDDRASLPYDHATGFSICVLYSYFDCTVYVIVTV